jgi:hypothetical protein
MTQVRKGSALLLVGTSRADLFFETMRGGRNGLSKGHCAMGPSTNHGALEWDPTQIHYLSTLQVQLRLYAVAFRV